MLPDVKNRRKMLDMKRLRDYIRPSLFLMAAGLIVKSLGAFIELLLPEIMARIIDDAVPQRNTRGILFLGAVMIICSILALWFNIIANRNAARTSRDITRRIRHDLFDQTLYLSCSKTDAYTIPSLDSRLTSDTYNVHQMLGMMQRMGIRAPIITVGGLAICFWMDAPLAVVFLAVIPFIAVLIYIRGAKGIPMYTDVQKAVDVMSGVVRENVQGIRVIKALSRTEYEKKRYAGVNRALASQQIRAGNTMAIIQPGMNLFLYLGMAGVIIYGAYRVNEGLSSAGTILAFLSYFTLISKSMMALSRMFIMFSKGMASSRRIMDVMNTETEKNWEKKEYPAGDPQYAIEFRNVSFSYLKVKDNVRKISFALKPGESLGIIGATGAGKSTILSLLLHFYDADEGAIYLNGKDIRSIAPSELRRMFGVVMQNDFLFADTISENIRFGRPVVDDEIDEAMQLAQASEFVESTERRLTSKGTNVSGGQRQRILLSRAFASHPDFLLLDDSSSALDYKTDARLRQALQGSFRNTTMIIIAQRVSSIQNCSQIMVLDHGNISGMGTHEELLKNNPIYAAIAESQMGGALFE